MPEPQHTILVAGDLVVDYHIYEGRRHHYGDGVSPGVRVLPQLGGAVLIHDLLDELLAPADSDTQPLWNPQLTVKVDRDAIEFLNIDESRRAYAFWRPYPPNGSPENQFWRVSEAMGFGASQRAVDCSDWPKAPATTVAPRIIILSEGGMGFRQNVACWEQLPFDTARWIVLKTAAPLATDPLWEKLSPQYADRLIVLVSARELRHSSARLNAGLSWDETVESVLHELRKGGALHALTQCRHLIVAFGSEGALWIEFTNSPDGQADQAAVHFVYDAESIEGEHAHQIDGTAFGFLSCLAAATAWQAALNEEHPDLDAALEGGLSAMRDLRTRGHGPVNEDSSGYPAKRLAGVIRRPTWRYSRASFDFAPSEATLPAERNLSILRESQSGGGPAYELARLIVRRGPIALANLPHLCIGQILAVDRREIESLRALTQIFRRYQTHDSGKKPLSIGVFGPPGSGKSFAVRELAEKFVGERSWMEFNLSQFDSPSDLIGAFHQIRDRVLQRLLPVAFFDEFDSHQFRWLQYLLAPMQDGRFQAGQITHPIGKCILIFAGGTSWTFETFGPPGPADGGETKDHAAFRLAKGPDFKSRLDAFLDVVGPDARQICPPPADVAPNAVRVVGGHAFAADPSDHLFPIRRALMIRSALKCAPEDKLDLDDGVVHALLRTESFRHGSRSLGKLLQPFQPHHAGPLVRSLLPPYSQIAMHTDADKFLGLCTDAPVTSYTTAGASGALPMGADDPLSEVEVSLLARAIHETYQVEGRKTGSPQAEKSFDNLGGFFQESNRAAARRMIRILDLVGLQIVPENIAASEDAAVHRHIEYHLELLAEAEHAGWMQWHLDQGWRYARERDDTKQRHDCLLPYLRLEHAQQEKDRNAVRHYQPIARVARKRIIFRRQQ